MASSWLAALPSAALCALLSATASATPPQADMDFDFPRSGAARVAGKGVTFPVTIRSTFGAAASTLGVSVVPGLTEAASVAVPALGFGEARTVSVTLPLHRVGTYAIAGMCRGLEFWAFVLVRPDRTAGVDDREYRASVKQVVDAARNDARHRARNGGPLDGIRLGIAADKSRYRRGEVISFQISIENVGDAPRTLVDGDLGLRDLSVHIDGEPVNHLAFDKSLPLVEPFPDGVLRLAPGARWDGRVTFAEPRDLEDIARWPVSTFTYRFVYQSFAVPFFTASPALDHLWQGDLSAGDGATLVVEHGVAPDPDAGGPPSPDAGSVSGAPPAKDAARCSGAAVGSTRRVDALGVGALLLLVRSRRRYRPAQRRLAASAHPS